MLHMRGICARPTPCFRLPQASRLSDLILKDLIPNGKGRQLVEVLDFVAARCVGHLPVSHQPLASKMQVQ